MNQKAMQPKRENQPTFFDLAVQQRGSANRVLETITREVDFPIPRRAVFMPLHRESRLDIRKPQTIRTLKRRERRAPIPTGLQPSA